MPLSKERDRKRKRLAKLNSVTDGFLPSKVFQPNSNLIIGKQFQPKSETKPVCDADGNLIPDYW